MVEDTLLPFSLPSVQRKKITAAFDGGRMTSDGGVMLLAAIENSLGVATKLASVIADPRNPALVSHNVADILRARMLAIACGYEDADDLDHLRTDPGFKLACGRLPDSGRDLCSQPTVSRLENTPDLRQVIRLTYALVDLYCASYPRPPGAVTLDIDDTVDVVHGHQQLSLFNAHYDERCFLPIHVYDTATSRPVAVLLRPGTTPSGAEVRNHLRRLVRRIRQHWPHTRLTIRGDGHYGRPEVMAFCEANGVDYILGLPGNKVLDRLVEHAADDVRVRRAEEQAVALRCYAEARYGAKSWSCQRRVAARIEATTKGLDIRFVVTNIAGGSAEWLYDTLYCARGQAENLIKLHKSQLASDRTSCRSALANQVRLVLHTGAFWLMLGLRDAIPAPQPLARAEFSTLRIRLIKIGPYRRDRQQGPDCLRGRSSRSSAVCQSCSLPSASRAMINGAQRPELARSCQPQRLHNMFRSAMKRRSGKPCLLLSTPLTLHPAEYDGLVNFNDGLAAAAPWFAGQVRQEDAGDLVHAPSASAGSATA